MGLTDCNIWICDNCGVEVKTSGTHKERIPEKWFVINKKRAFEYSDSHFGYLVMLQNIYNWKQTEYFCSFTCLLQTYTKED